MKKIYPVLINRKIEFIKLMLCILLAATGPLLLYTINRELTHKYSGENILYIAGILYISLFVIVFMAAGIKFNRFIKKNWESLTLLGVLPYQGILLFLLVNYELLFIPIYSGMMIYSIHGMKNGLHAVMTNAVNAFLAVSLGIILGYKLYSKKLLIPAFVIAGITGIMLGKDAVSYFTAYDLIMSDTVKNIVFSDNILSFIVKLSMLPCMAYVIILLYKKADIGGAYDFDGLHKHNFMGDFLHRLNRFSLFNKNYFWLYTNEEFICWKIFSTLFLAVICCINFGNMAVFLFAYGICLITSFYFHDIYNYERNHFLIFYMSDYSYKRLIADLTIGGLFILGDNVLPVLLVNCINNPTGIFVLTGMIILIFALSIFVNAGLYENYPSVKYNISVLLVLIKLHLPILNVFYVYKFIKAGKINWENLIYGDGK